VASGFSFKTLFMNVLATCFYSFNRKKEGKKLSEKECKKEQKQGREI
jgi:hypothetical protein